MIDLTCPQCQTELELDDGFAGGVCRCSECGHLIEVPQPEPADPDENVWPDETLDEDADYGDEYDEEEEYEDESAFDDTSDDEPIEPQPAAQSSARPDTPEVPDPTIPLHETPNAPPAAPPSKSPPRARRPVEQDTKRYHRRQTAEAPSKATPTSAKTTHHAHAQSDELLAKRKRVRLMLNAAFIAVAVLLISAGGVAVWLIKTSGQDNAQTPDPTPKAPPNPYLAKEPTFLLVPIQTSVVFVVDSSRPMNNVFSQVKQALLAGARTLERAQHIMTVFTAEDAPIIWPEALTPISALQPAQLIAHLDQVFAEGITRPQPAFDAAIGQRPKQIIYIATELGAEEAITAIRQKIATAPLRLDVILIDASNDLFKNMAETSGGTYTEVKSYDLLAWYREFLNLNNNSPITAENFSAAIPSRPQTP